MNYWKLIYIIFSLNISQAFRFGNTIFRHDTQIDVQNNNSLTLWSMLNDKWRKKKESKIDKINGFYGLVGPDVEVSKTNTLYELFTGDGVIQGIFLENGNIRQISHMVQTEKIQHEKIYGKFLNHMMFLPLYMFLNKIGVIPNVMGLANTAFMTVGRRFFVLFERDLPYEISLDFERKTIETMKRVNIRNIEHFSAHSTVEETTGKIYSLEYNVLNKIVSLQEMNESLGLLSKIDVKTRYIPIVHDSYVLSNSTIFTDSPLLFSFQDLIQGKIPIIFDTGMPTFIHQICRKTGSKTVYSSNDSFYIFHYANMTETAEKIEIWASVYESLDFSALNINGKYRRLLLDKNTKTIEMERNPELETYNLDFPIKWRDSIILRNVENKRINGFVICRGLEIQHRIFLDDISICGEPMVYDDGTFSRIMCLGYDGEMRGYFLLIDPETGRVFDFPLSKKVNIGFHSVFIEKESKMEK